MNMNQEILEGLEKTVTVGRPIEEEAGEREALIGSVFAKKYELLNSLGEGGMSVVYKARHLGMDKIVAVKVLHLHLVKDELSLKRFKQEALAASTLRHPGIVAIHDCGENEDGTPYLVMDLVEGTSLSEILQKEERLTAERFLSIMQQVAAALWHAHEAGVVHRDLKPSNVMITNEDGKDIVRIVDFGIAKMLRQSADSGQQLTQTGEVFGSPLYMSPEQCMGAAVDHRADIYSLGCLMYEALTGKVPFKGDTVYGTINKHLNDLPSPVVAPQVEDDLRQRLEFIILRAMAKAPEDRFQNMSDIEAGLRQLSLKSKAGLLGSIGGAWNLVSAKRRAARRNKLPLIVITLVSVSCLSTFSVLALESNLSKAAVQIKRLEQSRKLLRDISEAQEAFTGVSEAGRDYLTSALFITKKATAAREKFLAKKKTTQAALDKVDKDLASDKKMQEKFRNHWRKELDLVADEVSKELAGLNAGWGIGTLQNSLKVAQLGSQAAGIFTEMSGAARKVENERLGRFQSIEKGIAILSFLCIALNGSVVAALFLYFARGTPQKIRKLAEQASQLSRRRTGSQSESSQDVVADLDNVLHELATALSEAEEREKLLLQKLKAHEKDQAVTEKL